MFQIEYGSSDHHDHDGLNTVLMNTVGATMQYNTDFDRLQYACALIPVDAASEKTSVKLDMRL